MAYLEFVIPVRSWSNSEKEIVFAKLSLIGFEGFVDGEDEIQAYVEEDSYDPDILNGLIDELGLAGIRVQYRFHRTEDQNWNEEWEKQFDPVVIDERVLIRAPFHDSGNDRECTLIIEPKMSFGTGHHHTTRLMLREMLNHEFGGKKILDMGCGTGILGIFACKNGAERVLGVDIDQWSYENALENKERNGASCMEVRLGDVGVLRSEKFDIILANITRNILVRDMSVYAEHLYDRGLLMISGILAEDALFIFNEAYRCGLKHLSTGEDANWVSLTFAKENT